jgi:hypothetical protein
VSLDIEAIKARAEAATPGPWNAVRQWSPKPDRWNVNGYRYGPPAHRTGLTWGEAGGERIAETSEANARFISHARSDVPALVAEVARLRKLVEVDHGAGEECA